MAGLVLGVSVTDRTRAHIVPAEPDVVSHRLYIQESAPVPGRRSRKGFVLQQGEEPSVDSVEVPGAPLITRRGEPTRVTVVNRLRSPTSVHWHGMELESVFDGVAGYSGFNGKRAPLLAPGDSFTVWFTPPRAGTYMFHSHMDEEDQLASGMYAPLLVLEPGEPYDASTDLVMMVGLVPNERGGSGRALNGMRAPGPRTVQAGKPYRLRLINMLLAARVEVQLSRESAPQLWRLISKDGAHTPAALSVIGPARQFIAVGEAYDFTWTAPRGETTLTIRVLAPPGETPPPPIVQTLIGAP